jgi:toxin ParE1/3/4
VASIFWTDRARVDLLEIGDYIAQRSPLAALRFVDELMERTKVLVEQPRSGRIVPEIGTEDFRELIHGNYRLVYRLFGDQAHILTVFEGHRLFGPGTLDSSEPGD